MVKQRSNIIQFNGRRYDATTGRLLDSSPHPRPISDIIAFKPTKVAIPAVKTTLKPSTTSIDGLKRSGSQVATQLHKRTSKSVTLKRTVPKPVITVGENPIKKPLVSASRTVDNSLTAHRPIKSPTLMRAAVKKPDVKRKPKMVSITHGAQVAPKTTGVVAKKRMSDNLDVARLERSKQTPKHAKVDRFYTPTKLVDALAAKAPAHIEVKPAPSIVAASRRPEPKPNDLLSKALINARSHEETYRPTRKTKRKSSKLITAIVVTVSLFGLTAGLAYFNRGHIEMQFASAQAGFSAKSPSYTPGGFVYSGINHGAGEITLNYKDASSNTSYTINQTPSSWNSQTLLDSLSETHQDYQIKSTAGITVYVFENQATWVSGGILYKLVVSGSQLPTDQILKVAAGL